MPRIAVHDQPLVPLLSMAQALAARAKLWGAAIATKMRVLLKKAAWMAPLRRPPEASEIDTAQAQTLIQRLRSEQRSLRALTATLENEFLAIGEDLEEMTALARSIQAQYDGVLTATSGQKEDSALLFSLQLLKSAEALIQSSHEQYKRIFTVFKEVEGAVSNAVEHQEDLQRIWAILPFIVAQFRIQASPFDAATRDCFYVLAGEVDGLLASVRSAVGEQFQHLGETQALSQKVAADMVHTIVQHKTDIMVVLAESRSQLANLERSLADSTHLVHGMFEISQGAERGIDRLVRALQGQDSARQKIEHVCEAIDDLEKTLQGVANQSTSSSERRRLLSGASEIAFLQRRQIEVTFSDLEAIAQEITGGIQDIHDAMDGVVGSALQAGRLAVESGVVGKSIKAIRTTTDICQMTLAKTDQVFECIAPLRTTFSKYASRISDLAYGVRLSALNAQIYASNLAGGEALSVLSEQARQVSDRSMEHASSLSKHLDGIGATIECLRHGLKVFQSEARTDLTAMQGKTTVCEQKLHGLRDELPRMLAGLQPSLAKLGALAKCRANQLSFPGIVAEARASSIALFDELTSKGQHDFPAEGIAPRGQLAHMRARYTMADERMVHEKAVNELGSESQRTQKANRPVALAREIEPGVSSPPAYSGISDRPPQAAHGAVERAPESSDIQPNKDLGDNLELF